MDSKMIAKNAKTDSFLLSALSEDERNRALTAIAEALTENKDAIFAANEKDLAEGADLPGPILGRLKFDQHKLDDVTSGIHDIIGLSDPIHRTFFRRQLADDLVLEKVSCLVCNQQEAGLLFSVNYDHRSAQELAEDIRGRAEQAKIRRLVVTMGENGAAYTETGCGSGYCSAKNVDIIDTTGCGDAFFAGVAVGLTYGKTLKESCEIGTVLASSVIATNESVCPSFRPEEFGLKI